MKQLVKDALILTAITLIAGLLLGVVYEVTKAPIAAANEAATQAAYREVFADADKFVAVDGFDSEAATGVVAADYAEDKILNCVQALDVSGNPVGYVVTVVSSAGYGGNITFHVGIQNDGTVNGYSITDISETAGLGMNAKGEKFSSQFVNKLVDKFTVVKSGAASESDIQAISGATITSRAMTNGVNAAITYFNTLEGGAQ